MRHSFLHDGSWWSVWCLPRYHRIEGLGVVVFTPRVQQERHLYRCCCDSDAQYFLRWSPDRVANVLGPDPVGTRLNVLPRPWANGFMNFGCRRMGSREIIATSWIESVSGGVELSTCVRVDQRRSSVAIDSVRAVVALFSRHFGVDNILARTASVNVGANRTLEALNAELVESEAPRNAPTGEAYFENLYRFQTTSVSTSCRWGYEFGR